jgi:hypothetical protein
MLRAINTGEGGYHVLIVTLAIRLVYKIIKQRYTIGMCQENARIHIESNQTQNIEDIENETPYRQKLE